MSQLRILPGNIGDYDQQYASFDWSQARALLGFPDGEYNIGWYCSDRVCAQGKGGHTALIWESADGELKRFSFDDLRRYSNAYAEYFRSLGLVPGDIVAVFMERVPELYFGMLGGLKAGLIMQPLFSAFREDAVEKRLTNAGTKAVLTQRKLAFRIRNIKDKCPTLAFSIIAEPGDLALSDFERRFDIGVAEPLEQCAIFPATEETPSLLHYTSGTTGQPKGALHVHGSLVCQALTSRWVLDLRDDDVFWCTADPGWVTGTSYGVIGPWCLGVTQFVQEAGFIVDRWYKALSEQQISVWYTAPTAIRLLMKEGTAKVQERSYPALRHMCSVGEPLNPEGVVWGQEAFGLPFYDTWFQTETGAIFVTNFPGMEIRPGSMGKSFPGCQAVVLSDHFEPIETPGVSGLLALKPGWPSMFRTYLNNDEQYQSKFKNGWYLTGDKSSIDSDGYFWFQGRSDDVINTGGHLVGPFEIESALLEHAAVAESAAIGKPDPEMMEVVKAFVALKPGFEPSRKLEMDIISFIRKKLSPLAMPREIEFVDKLPKTRSGKIMRRLLKAQETGQEIGDVSTLEDD